MAEPQDVTPTEDAVPHEPIDTPWTFRRANEHGHVHVEAAPGSHVVTDEDGRPLPMRSHARIYLNADGPQVGIAIIHPNGKVEGTVHDPMLGARLIRHVGFNAVTVTHDKVIISDRELNP